MSHVDTSHVDTSHVDTSHVDTSHVGTSRTGIDDTPVIRVMPNVPDALTHTITADLDTHGTNAALHGGTLRTSWRALTSTQRATLAKRFPGVPDSTLARIVAAPAGVTFPPDVGPHGPARVQRATVGTWRQTPGTPMASVEYFNQNVSVDWLCWRAPAHAHPLDSTPPTFAPTWDLSGEVVVKDALILYDNATRIAMAVLVSSHAEFAAAVERWIHHYCVMRTLSSDGEPANSGPTLQALRREYGIPFARYNAPYHPYQNERVEAFIALLKRRTALSPSSCRSAPTRRVASSPPTTFSARTSARDSDASRRVPSFSLPTDGG
jgi:hypothetical protein